MFGSPFLRPCERHTQNNWKIIFARAPVHQSILLLLLLLLLYPERRMSSWPRRMSSWPRRMFSWPRRMSSWPRRMSSWRRRMSSWARRMSSWARRISSCSRIRKISEHQKMLKYQFGTIKKYVWTMRNSILITKTYKNNKKQVFFENRSKIDFDRHPR